MGAFFSYLKIVFRWLQMLRSAHTSTLEPAAFNSNANYNESVKEASMRLKTVQIWEGKFGYASNLKLSVSIKKTQPLMYSMANQCIPFFKWSNYFKIWGYFSSEKNSSKIQNSPWIIIYPGCDVSGASSSLLGGPLRSLDSLNGR